MTDQSLTITGPMSHTRLALLLTNHPWYVDSQVRGFCLGCLDDTGKKLLQFPTVEEFAEHSAALITTEFLVIPRDAVLGAMYGIRHAARLGSTVSVTADQAQAVRKASELAAQYPELSIAPVQRPILAWCAIEAETDK